MPLYSKIANYLKSATTVIDVQSATAPSSGQVLTATGSTAATWQTPSGGGGAWTLVSSASVTADFTISSLDLATDKMYLLVWYAQGHSGATTKVRFNGDTSNSYESMTNTVYYGGASATNSVARNRGTDGVYVNRVSGAEPQTNIQQCHMTISQASGSRINCEFRTAGSSSASANTEHVSGTGTLESTTNLTSIDVDFATSPTSGFYRLYKLSA